MSQQVIKISAGYSSKKSQDYNSEAHSISLEKEVIINGNQGEIQNAADELFNLCRSIVNAQKGAPAPVPAPQPTNGNGRPASEKQVKAIFAISKALGMQNGAIDELASRFGKAKLAELSSKEASQIIESLKAQQ